MANYETLKSSIQQVVRANGNQEITGDILQQVLLAMVNSLGDGYQFAGIATPSTNPGVPDQRVFYIAAEPGYYSNFGGVQVVATVKVLKYDAAWTAIDTMVPNVQGTRALASFIVTATDDDDQIVVDRDVDQIEEMVDNGLRVVLNYGASQYGFVAIGRRGPTTKTAIFSRVYDYTGENPYLETVIIVDDVCTIYTDGLAKMSLIGVLSHLQTEYKTDLVGAINEVTQNVTELSQDVSELDLQVGNSIVYTIKAGYLKNDGTYGGVNTTTSKTTLKINCKVGDIFCYKGLADGAAVSALYYAGDNIVGSVAYNAVDDYREITIPDNVDGVIFSSYSTSTPILDVYYKDGIKQKIDKINTDITGLSGITALNENNLSDILGTYVPIVKSTISTSIKTDRKVVLFADGSIADANLAAISTPIHLYKGEAISAKVSAQNSFAVFAQIYQSYYVPVLKGDGGNIVKTYYYLAKEDCDIVVSYLKDSGIEVYKISNAVHNNTIDTINAIEPCLSIVSHKGYLKADGTIGGTANVGVYGKHTSRIKCNKGDIYLYRGFGQGNATSVIFMAGDTIVSASIYDAQNVPVAITIPDGTDGVVFASHGVGLTSADDVVLDITRKNPVTPKYLSSINASKDVLSGKKWIACGDSYTHGESGISADVWTDEPYVGKRKTYPYWIGRRNNMVIEDFAIAGRTLAYKDGTKNEFSIADGNLSYNTIPSDADYITLWFGINDRANNIPIGNDDDVVNTTFKGAWNIVLSWIVNNRPNAKVGIVVSNFPDASDFSGYADATRVMAKKYGIPVLDLQKDEKIPYFLYQKERTDVAQSIKDARDAYYRVSASNLHPNVKAHEYESTFIENWLRSL